MTTEGWHNDPALEGRQRYHDGNSWTEHVSAGDGSEPYQEPYLGPDGTRWQYGVVNIGTFNSGDRMHTVFGYLGSQGWELVTVYDKASNWVANWEKGFILFKRPVPPGKRLDEDQWCISLTL